MEKLLKIIEEQNNKIRELEAEISKLISLIEHKTVNAQYKDRLFKFIFGNPENKPWTLALYNAVNGTHYTNLNDLQFNTLEEALYMKMKNDISFIIHFEMNLWEHQSSFNPNTAEPCRRFLLQNVFVFTMVLNLSPKQRLFISVTPMTVREILKLK